MSDPVSAALVAGGVGAFVWYVVAYNEQEVRREEAREREAKHKADAERARRAVKVPEPKPEPAPRPDIVYGPRRDWIERQRRWQASDLSTQPEPRPQPDGEPASQPAPAAQPPQRNDLFLSWFGACINPTGLAADVVTLEQYMASYGSFCAAIGHHIADPAHETSEFLKGLNAYAQQGQCTLGEAGEILGVRLRGQG